MFRVFLSNHGYYVENEFPTFDLALAWVRTTCFQARIDFRGTMVASWCPIGGLRRYA